MDNAFLLCIIYNAYLLFNLNTDFGLAWTMCNHCGRDRSLVYVLDQLDRSLAASCKLLFIVLTGKIGILNKTCNRK